MKYINSFIYITFIFVTPLLLCATALSAQSTAAHAGALLTGGKSLSLYERISAIEQRYSIQIHFSEFPIDTGRFAISAAPRETGAQKKLKTRHPYQNKDTTQVPNLVKPGERKTRFAYLQVADSIYRDSLLQIFSEEWEKYPPAFIRSIDIKNVYFVRNLQVYGQTRYAMPDGASNDLYYNTDYVGIRKESYLRHSLHHELYHLIEKQFFGDFYYVDATWASFNPPLFSYSTGGADAYAKQQFSKQVHPYKGFVSGYATSGLEEDKAEVFAYMMTGNQFLQLLRWSQDDIILAQKMAYMMGFTRGICREMDMEYFLKIHEIKTKQVSQPLLPNDIY
ncbi:hypothetical protein COR50_13640 [Chitinophaga caeni]|uniref:Peptidase MA-like domain-containing protein n=1 Tax=Chitinophaga caeni TaxID=2029983 RepID=A0A291QW11_9BACT|nr:putative zinc-binding metallopeptidase [Chitinophaga caeni]ATL48120.1 hypothetical protein COR50_13640 [Chitinophaga caeni]